MKAPLKIIALILIIGLLGCQNISTNNENKATDSLQIESKITEFDNSYAHVVYFWFKNPENSQDRVLFEESLNKFLKQSKFAKTNFIGTPPNATRDVVDDSFTYNLILTFESAVAQQAYQDEAAHKVFINECEHLWEKVIVYDATSIQ